MNMRILFLCLLCLPFVSYSSLYSSGGADLELPVRWYGQTRSERWGEKFLGTSRIITIHTHGCALTAAAMVLDYYNVRTNPGRLNEWLVDHNGFDDGWDDDSGEYLGKVRILWQVPAENLDEIASYSRVDFRNTPADPDMIRTLLNEGIPVIAEVVRPGGIPHFVVIYGYKGEEFLIRDPLDENTRYLSEQYNISDSYGSGSERNILGLRIYRPSGS